ncbi:MAG: sensor histidine kinase [Roseiflexaceae bacterium]|nr:sensor histidine kinase [Roseiflexaceae bacterium]
MSDCPPNQPAHAGTDTASSLRVYRYISLFWTVILYISIGFSVYAVAKSTPERLSGWTGVLMFATLAGFCAMYHALYLRGDNWWPMPAWRARIYFPVEIALLAVLVWFSPAFSGIAYALFAHACTLLRWRYWALPVSAIALILAWSYGAFSGDPFALLVVCFSVLIVLGTFGGIYVLTHQRFQLSATVGELRLAKAELELRAEQTEELAALRERSRLARDMHDSIGHALVVMNVKLEAAQRLYRKDSARGDDELVETRALIRQTMTELRHSLANLRAPLASYADLPIALERIAAETRTRGLDVQVSVAADLALLSEQQREIIWRVARESLANVEKHAAAASATLALDQHEGSLRLCVIDDGSGITPADLQRPGHFGVVGMAERLLAIGGTLAVQSRPQGGTIVEARFPPVGQSDLS